MTLAELLKVIDNKEIVKLVAGKEMSLDRFAWEGKGLHDRKVKNVSTNTDEFFDFAILVVEIEGQF